MAARRGSWRGPAQAGLAGGAGCARRARLLARPCGALGGAEPPIRRAAAAARRTWPLCPPAAQVKQLSPATKRKTYTFYYMSEDGDIAAARSSGGGMALLRRLP